MVHANFRRDNGLARFLVVLSFFVVHEVFFDLKVSDQGDGSPEHDITTQLLINERKRIRLNRDSSLPRPNWRASLDCSIFELDCLIRKRYAPYPFDFWNKTLPATPSSELDHLLRSKPKQLTSDTILKNRPRLVANADKDKCLKYARDTPFDQQLDNMLNRLSRALNRHVAYTMSDIGYAKDMIHDVFAMAHDIVGFPNSFFMVAIDDETVELGCRYGYPVLPSPRKGGLEDRVKFTKFQVSSDLVQRGQDFLFFEMDVWFFRSILPFLQQQTGDMLVSSHQNSPQGMNIGVYAVNANDATREYFQHCIDVASIIPIHDQKLMQNLDLVSSLQESGHDVPAKYPNVTFKHFIHSELLGSHEIASSEWPRATYETIAFHPLSTQPLMGPHGKMQIAKELGVYYGSYGYYSSEEQYLWLDRLDNSYSMVMNFQHKGWGIYHNGQVMKWTMATMIALAKRTNRIWVLPRIQADIGRHFLWRILDMKTVEELGVEVRETSFLSNPKVSEFPSVSRTAAGEHMLFWQQDDKQTKVWQLKEKDNMATLFSLAERIESNALLVNPHLVDAHWPSRFPEENYDGEKLTPIEKEIYDVYIKLKWCNFDCRTKVNSCNEDWSSNFWDSQRLTSASAAHDCYGRGVLTG